MAGEYTQTQENKATAMPTRLAQSQHMAAEAVGANTASQPDFDTGVSISRRSRASYSAKGAAVRMTQLTKEFHSFIYSLEVDITSPSTMQSF